MNTKSKSSSTGRVVCLLFVLVFSSCRNERSGQSHESHVQSGSEYICPMRCEGDKTYPQPGNCPVCNMELQLVADELVQAVPPNEQVLSNQATVKLQPGTGGKQISAQGYIVPAQNHNQSVAVRFGGRIEKLYVRFSNQYVSRGERIMDVYSPELRTYQQEHLFLFKSRNESTLIQKSREKLRLLGITESQINRLENNGTVALTISIHSPVSGYVFFGAPSIQGNTTPENASAMNTMGMRQNESNENGYAAPDSQIREGMYINPGQTLFSVNPLRQVWALVSVPNHYLNLIHEKQSVEVVPENYPAKTLYGKVGLIEKTFQETSQRFARVRIVLGNPDNFLKINSLVTAHFALSDGNSLQVPSSAVYRTGLNAYVWVKTDTTRRGTGIFRTRKVITGSDNNGMTAIRGGLSPDEEIALRAGLMTDSETFLHEK